MNLFEVLFTNKTQETSGGQNFPFTFKKGFIRYYLLFPENSPPDTGNLLVMLPKGVYVFIRIFDDCSVKIVREATYEEVINYPEEPLSAGFLREKERALLATRR